MMTRQELHDAIAEDERDDREHDEHREDRYALPQTPIEQSFSSIGRKNDPWRARNSGDSHEGLQLHIRKRNDIGERIFRQPRDKEQDEHDDVQTPRFLEILEFLQVLVRNEVLDERCTQTVDQLIDAQPNRMSSEPQSGP
mgnify:CR=1 FL=1